MFFPSQSLKSMPRDKNLQEVYFVTADNIKLNGWYIDNKSDTTIIFFHGNGGNIYDNQERITLFQALGVNALMFDYRGFGKSEGTIEREGDIYADGEAAYQYVTSRGTKPENSIIWWQSLGGAVAMHTALWKPLKRTIIESTFTSMDEKAQETYWFLPTSLMLRFHFDNIAKIADVHSPILVIHSSDDEILGIENSKRLFEKANNPKEFLETKGSHNGGFSQSYNLYRENLEKFLKK